MFSGSQKGINREFREDMAWATYSIDKVETMFSTY